MLNAVSTATGRAPVDPAAGPGTASPSDVQQFDAAMATSGAPAISDALDAALGNGIITEGISEMCRLQDELKDDFKS